MLHSGTLDPTEEKVKRGSSRSHRLKRRLMLPPESEHGEMLPIEAPLFPIEKVME